MPNRHHREPRLTRPETPEFSGGRDSRPSTTGANSQVARWCHSDTTVNSAPLAGTRRTKALVGRWRQFATTVAGWTVRENFAHRHGAGKFPEPSPPHRRGRTVGDPDDDSHGGGQFPPPPPSLGHARDAASSASPRPDVPHLRDRCAWPAPACRVRSSAAVLGRRDTVVVAEVSCWMMRAAPADQRAYLPHE